MKIWLIIYYIFVAIIIFFALLFIISNFPIPGNFKVLSVLSGSMEPKIKTGSIVVVIPSKEYKIGDVITFDIDKKDTAPITHRIYDVKVEGGQAVYTTKGDANSSPDTEIVIKKNINGKVLFSIPYFGYAINFIKKPIGFFLIIIIPALLIIADEIKKIYNEVKKSKNKQNKD